MIDNVFHCTKLAAGAGVRAIEVDVGILVGAGVMGENFFGFGVAEEKSTDANEGKVCVGALLIALTGVGVASCAQAVIKTQTIKVRINARFIKSSISGEN
jgi:hypothetical protein